MQGRRSTPPASPGEALIIIRDGLGVGGSLRRPPTHPLPRKRCFSIPGAEYGFKARMDGWMNEASALHAASPLECGTSRTLTRQRVRENDNCTAISITVYNVNLISELTLPAGKSTFLEKKKWARRIRPLAEATQPAGGGTRKPPPSVCIPTAYHLQAASPDYASTHGCPWLGAATLDSSNHIP